MTLLRLLSIIVLFIAVVVSGQEKGAVDDEGCVLTSSECTCAENPAQSECTRSTKEGKCLQGDCKPSHKCDCFGYELCAVSKCGKWSPAVSAILSRSTEFRCGYEAEGAQCRSAKEIMDTLESSDNAKSASTKYVDDIAKDEAELAKDVADAVFYKMQALDALKAITSRVDEVLPKELAEVSELAAEVMTETKLVVREMCEASAESSVAFESMVKARTFRSEAREDEAAAEAEELAEEKAGDAARKKGEECQVCAEMKDRIKEIRQARRKASKTAGAWAKKGRGSRSKVRAMRVSSKKRKAKVQHTSAECIAKAQKILNRLGGDST